VTKIEPDGHEASGHSTKALEAGLKWMNHSFHDEETCTDKFVDVVSNSFKALSLKH
jgi:hypothetical protein